MLPIHPACAALAKVAARDASRYSMNAVRLCDLGGAYQAEATDGRRLLRVQAEATEPGRLGAREALVPADFWAEALVLGKKAGLGKKDAAVQLHLRGERLTATCLGRS